MPDSANFALHRPDIEDALLRGEEKMTQLMRGSTMHCRGGTTLVAADTDHPFVYRLRQGWACRARPLVDGRDQFILMFLPGDFFALKSMFVTRHSDDIRLLSDATIERIEYRKLRDVYLRDGDVAARCIWQVMEEERRLHNWVVGLGQGSADERLALLMMDFRARLIASGSLAGEALSFEMPLTQTQLAAHLGLTAVHVNRVLKEFRQREVLHVRERLVTIDSLKELVRIAYPLLDSHERNATEFTGIHKSTPTASSRRGV